MQTTAEVTRTQREKGGTIHSRPPQSATLSCHNENGEKKENEKFKPMSVAGSFVGVAVLCFPHENTSRGETTVEKGAHEQNESPAMRGGHTSHKSTQERRTRRVKTPRKAIEKENSRGSLSRRDRDRERHSYTYMRARRHR